VALKRENEELKDTIIHLKHSALVLSTIDKSEKTSQTGSKLKNLHFENNKLKCMCNQKIGNFKECYAENLKICKNCSKFVSQIGSTLIPDHPTMIVKFNSLKAECKFHQLMLDRDFNHLGCL
jgi:hypothetical protein